jgi:hypothetical protein
MNQEGVLTPFRFPSYLIAPQLLRIGGAHKPGKYDWTNTATDS